MKTITYSLVKPLTAAQAKVLEKYRKVVRPGRVLKVAPDSLTVSWNEDKINEELKAGNTLQALCAFFDEVNFYKGVNFDRDKVKAVYENI